jgi:hypothetical protein
MDKLLAQRSVHVTPVGSALQARLEGYPQLMPCGFDLLTILETLNPKP